MVIEAATGSERLAAGHARIARLPDEVPPPTSGPEITWSDSRLVTECLAGNERAWMALVDKYKNLIYSIPVRHGLSPPDASDIFQSVIADLLSKLATLRDAHALPAWLIQVTIHRCTRWKRLQLREVPVADDNSQVDLAAGRRDTPESLAHEAEREQMLREAVYRASPRCREMIHMLFYESPARPYADVAASLGIAVGSIGFLRRKCLDHLRKFLDNAGFSSP